MNRDNLRALVLRHEAERLLPYVDTRGKITIGVGRNLTDRGISRDESRYLLDHDLAAVMQGLLVRGQPWYPTLDETRQLVCADMAFNLGLDGFFGFRKMIAYLAVGDTDHAALEMADSDWYGQVKTRGETLRAMMQSGARPAWA